MRINSYAVIARAVEEGARAGVVRAYQYMGVDEHLSQVDFADIITNSVLEAIGEVVAFEDFYASHSDTGSDVPGGGAA